MLRSTAPRAWGLTEQLPSRPGGRTPGEETCTCFCIFQVFYDYVLLLGEILLNLLRKLLNEDKF